MGVVDTTFARVDMASVAMEELRALLPDVRVVRLTVPGIKNTVWGALRLIQEGCEAVLVLGWVGPSQVDKYSYLAASVGLIQLQLQTGRLVIDVTVHEEEAEDDRSLKEIAIDRARKHAWNLAMLLSGKGLERYAGMGLRQGYPHKGPIYM